MSLRKKTLSGMVWTFGQQFSGQLISFVVSIILARLLLPAQFGLIGMLSIFISVGRSLMDTGLTSSIIRTKDADQRDYSTVFFINLIGSVIIYAIVFFLAPFIASFYKQEILTSLVRVYSLLFIFQAFMGMQNALLTIKMDFKTIMLIEIPSILIGGTLGVILAYYGFGVWSLVYMSLSQAFLSSLQHWLYSSWRPDWIFDTKRFKKHFDFGYKITLAGLLETIFQNLYTILIGKYFSATQLGYYTRAFSFRQLPISNISAAIGKVTYPMLSSIGQDDIKLKSIYKKLMQQVIFWIAPLMIILMVVAEPLFRFLLTEKWLPAVPYFQILCFSGIFVPLQSYNLNMIKVKGRTDLTLRLQVIKKTYSIVGIFCAFPFGIYGLLYFQIITGFIDYVLNCYYSGKMVNYYVKEQLLDILPAILLSIIIGIIVWMFDRHFLMSINMMDLLRIAMDGVLYFSMYLGVSYTIKLPALVELIGMVFKKKNSVFTSG